MSLCDIATEAAKAAGDVIISYQDKSVAINRKAGGDTLASQVVTEVDQQCEDLILAYLAQSVTDFDLAVLSEELEDDGQRLVKDYFWCIDPMDGTLAFTQSEPGYSVSIALVSKAGSPLVGVVYDPVTHTLYSAVKGEGAYRNGLPWQSYEKSRSKLTLPCDQSLMERAGFDEFLASFDNWAKTQGYDGLKLIHHGGAVMNACRVLENAPGCYFKLPKPQNGGGSCWDFAATACLYREMSFKVSDFGGLPLALNPSGSTFMNHCGVMYASDARIADAVRHIWEQQSVSKK